MSVCSSVSVSLSVSLFIYTFIYFYTSVVSIEESMRTLKETNSIIDDVVISDVVIIPMY